MHSADTHLCFPHLLVDEFGLVRKAPLLDVALETFDGRVIDHMQDSPHLGLVLVVSRKFTNCHFHCPVESP